MNTNRVVIGGLVALLALAVAVVYRGAIIAWLKHAGEVSRAHQEIGYTVLGSLVAIAVAVVTAFWCLALLKDYRNGRR